MDSLVGLFIFFALVIFSRIINERALKRLNVEDKAKLIDALSNYRIYNFVAVIIIIFLYLTATKYFTDIRIISFVYIGVIFCLLLTIGAMSFRLLKRIQMPDNYIKNYLLSTTIKFVGFGILLLQTLIMK